jgi:DNA-binding transcriptional MerR regulator
MPQLLTINEVARLTNRSTEAVRALVKRYGIEPHSTNGYNIRVSLADVLRVVERIEHRVK